MSKSIRHSDEIYTLAKEYGDKYNRTIAQQIAWWVKLCCATEQNPDLPLPFVKELLEVLESPDSTYTAYTPGCFSDPTFYK